MVQQKPHLVLILADDLGWNMTGYSGNPHIVTPAMDQLVQDEGLILDRHYAHSSCGPSRASLLTGRVWMRAGIAGWACPDSIYGPALPMTLLPAKLRAAGYATHQQGKWDAGMASVSLLPFSRGFDTSYGFLWAKEDHWQQTLKENVCAIECDMPPATIDVWEDDRPRIGVAGTAYGDLLWTERAVEIIDRHDAASRPLFLYLCLQAPHDPYQAPAELVSAVKAAGYKGGTNPLNQLAMSLVVDEAVANVTAALKRREMWQQTLLVVASDNGGYNGGYKLINYPLRGFKGTSYEGGIRVAAFVSGGLLPQQMRGRRTTSLMHLTDWYATFCGLAGVDAGDDVVVVDGDGVSSSMPSIDSIDQWPVLSGATSGAVRTELWAETGVLLRLFDVGSDGGGDGDDDGRLLFKLNLDHEDTLGTMLHDLTSDPSETTNLASDWPDTAAAMAAQLTELQATAFAGTYDELLPSHAAELRNAAARNSGVLVPIDFAWDWAKNQPPAAPPPPPPIVITQKHAFGYFIVGGAVGAIAIAYTRTAIKRKAARRGPAPPDRLTRMSQRRLSDVEY